MTKKKILWCNECSSLATGYATYGRETMSRLHATNKYEIAELSLYVSYQDPAHPNQLNPKIASIPWKVYANAPEPNDEAGFNQYNNIIANQFGAWRFEDVVLDFRPDIVVNVMDPWMMEYLFTSPFSDLYHKAIMPTVDSAPQQEAWINMFTQADSVFTYAKFGTDVLIDEGAGKINVLGEASPAANVEHFYPIFDKKQHKQKFGLNPESFIIGTVMRNQKRKLYPDILDAFKKYLDKAGALSKNTYLYFHVSYPDQGWDIPDLIKKSGLSHKILLTYQCRACQLVFPSFFQGAKVCCPNCRRFEAGLPNTQNPIPSEYLGQVMNLFDVYIQASIAGAIEMPLVEAGACGIPLMTNDYAGMGSVIDILGGKKIKNRCKFLEAETQAYRVYIDTDDLADAWIQFFNLPEQIRKKKGLETYHNFVKKWPSYDDVAAKWMNVFDNVQLDPERWNRAPHFHNPQTQLPANATNSQFAKWAIVNILGDPSKLNTYFELKLIKDLDYGAYIPGFGGMYINEFSHIGMRPTWQRFNREDAAQKLYDLCQYRNMWEQRRTQGYDKPEFILRAKP